MARLDHRPLEIDGGVAEGRARLGAGAAQRLGQLRLLADEAHALAAAAHGGLEHHRVADLAGQRAGLVVGAHRLQRARHHRHLQLARELAGRRLVAHGADGRRRRPHEGQPGGAARLGEARVLGEEAVARVHGVGAGGAGGGDERVDRQVALGGRRRSDRVRLVGHEHVQRLAVGLREDRHGGDALLAAGADDAHRDLAPVGDEQLLDLHGRLRRHRRSFSASRRKLSSTMSFSGSGVFMSFWACHHAIWRPTSPGIRRPSRSW